MSRHILTAIIAFALIFLSSCKKDEDGTLSLEFRAKLNEQPLQLNTRYPFQNGEIEFTMVKFYVSNISVQDKDENATQELVGVDLLSMSANNVLNFSLKEGAYKNLNVGIGLDAVRDATDPSDYSPNHPMGINQNTFWIMSQSYIFVKLEGYYYANGETTLFTYHLGDSSFYRTLSSSNAFSIYGNNTTSKIVTINLENAFANFDIATKDNTHTVGDEEFAGQMMDDFFSGFSIR